MCNPTPTMAEFRAPVQAQSAGRAFDIRGRMRTMNVPRILVFGTPHGGKAHRPAGRRWSRSPRSRTVSWSSTSFSIRLHSTLTEIRADEPARRQNGPQAPRSNRHAMVRPRPRKHRNFSRGVEYASLPRVFLLISTLSVGIWRVGAAPVARLYRVSHPDIRDVSRSCERISSPERRDREQRDRKRRGAWYAK